MEENNIAGKSYQRLTDDNDAINNSHYTIVSKGPSHPGSATTSIREKYEPTSSPKHHLGIRAASKDTNHSMNEEERAEEIFPLTNSTVSLPNKIVGIGSDRENGATSASTNTLMSSNQQQQQTSQRESNSQLPSQNYNSNPASVSNLVAPPNPLSSFSPKQLRALAVPTAMSKAHTTSLPVVNLIKPPPRDKRLRTQSSLLNANKNSSPAASPELTGSPFKILCCRVYGVVKPLLGICLALLQCLSVAFVSLMVSFIEKTGTRNLGAPSPTPLGITNLSTITTASFPVDYVQQTTKDADPGQLQIKTGVSPYLISNMRFIYQLMIAVPLALYNRDPLLPPKRYAIPVLSRCIAGSLGVVSLNFAMSYAPISDASSIIYTSPIYVAILARIFLKEKISLIDTALLFVTVIGVLFITRPAIIFKHILPNDKPAAYLDKRYPNHYLGLGFAAVSAFASSVAIVSIRKVRSLPFSLILIDFALVGILLTTALSLGFGAYTLPPCTKDRYLLLGSSLLGSLGQFFLYGALRFENAGIISATASMGIVFTIILQIVFKGENLPWTSAFGASLVTLSIAMLGVRKWLVGRREVRRTKKKKRLEQQLSKIIYNGPAADTGGTAPKKISLRSARSMDEIKQKYSVANAGYENTLHLVPVPEDQEISSVAGFGPDVVATPSIQPSGPHTPLDETASMSALPHGTPTPTTATSQPPAHRLTKKVSTRSQSKGIAGLIENLSRRSSIDRTGSFNKKSTASYKSSAYNLFQFAPRDVMPRPVTGEDGRTSDLDDQVTAHHDYYYRQATENGDVAEDEADEELQSGSDDSESSVEYGAIIPAPD